MTSDPSPAKKALDYAENQLGVNRIFEDATAKRAALENILLELDAKRATKRLKEQFIEDVKMEVIEEERGQNPNESQAAFDRRIKVVFSNNGDIRETREELSFLAGEMDSLETQAELLAKDIQISVARMQELGGYLQYLAEIKRSQSSIEKPKQEDRNPW